MGDFIPGIELSRAFYDEVVAGIIGDTPHSAALLGEGSEVLGFDTERSTDHSWGLRLQVFVDEDVVGSLRGTVANDLPTEFRGWPVRYFRWQTNQVDHHVEISPLGDWLKGVLGSDPRPAMTTAMWLATPQQLLLQVTRGAVFRDDSGELTSIREMLKWYPRDVWLWMMACQWQLIQDKEPLVGRAAEVGDEIGSRLVASRIVQDLMRLCFLQERKYAPYLKWLGTGFAQLDANEEVGTLLNGVLTAEESATRENSLALAYEAVARRHNDLQVIEALDPRTGPFDVRIGGATRPFHILNAGRFAGACCDAIEDEGLKNLDLLGSVDQLLEPTDLLVNFSDWPSRIATYYKERLS